ncbi:PREDICTED: avidin-like, partial [Gekko japonicus]|uniref:Avidin-like n=1 Tax=Gekko japonicus TaxID=146911 RepID=A0ABM1K4I9_GEKJA
SLQCSLTGKWLNDLGSTMRISPPDDAGAFSGSYLTKVSISNQTIVKSPLWGAQHKRDQPTFGFVVLWNFTATTTTFVGQCFVDEKGVETLETLWLLRKEVPKHGDDWWGTLVGKNVFKRIK